MDTGSLNTKANRSKKDHLIQRLNFVTFLLWLGIILSSWWWGNLSWLGATFAMLVLTFIGSVWSVTYVLGEIRDAIREGNHVNFYRSSFGSFRKYEKPPSKEEFEQAVKDVEENRSA